MKKIWNKKVAGVLAGFVVLSFLSTNVFAFVSVAENIYSRNATGQGLSGSDYVGQEFKVFATSTITSFTFSATNGTTNVSRSWTLGLFAQNGTSLNSTAITNAVVGAHSAHTDITLNFSSNVTVAPGQYFIGIKYNSGEGVTLDAQSPGQYTLGCMRSYDGTGPITDNGCISNYDQYFIVNGVGTTNIDFVFPTNDTITTDFSQWGFVYSAATIDDVTAVVNYRTSDNSITGQDTSAVLSSIATNATDWFPKLTALPVGSVISAQLSLLYGSSTVASSSIIIFQVGTTGSVDDPTFFNPVKPTSTSTDMFLTCDSSSGFFQDSLCNLMTFLFVPTPASLANFSNLRTDLSAKPPFGYWSVYSTAFSSSSLANGTSSINLNNTGIASLTVFGTLRTGISWLLYIFFGSFIIKRVSKWDFH